MPLIFIFYVLITGVNYYYGIHSGEWGFSVFSSVSIGFISVLFMLLKMKLIFYVNEIGNNKDDLDRKDD